MFSKTLKRRKDTYNFIEWENCYRERWGEKLNAESFEHPAKVAPGLSKRIYEFALENGWLKVGDTVLDPFAGIAGFGYYAMLIGLNFVGVELEQHFVDRAAGCECTGITKEDWLRFHGRYRQINFKDGRHYCPQCIRQAESKPEEQPENNNQLSLFELKPPPTARYTQNSGEIPFTNPHIYKGNLMIWKALGMRGDGVCIKGDSRYLEYYLAQAGIIDSDLSLGSPPFLAQSGGTNVTSKTGHLSDDALLKRHAAGNIAAKGYGDTDGQMGAMEGKKLDSVLGSPPFLDNNVNVGSVGDTPGKRQQIDNAESRKNSYGVADGQMGNMKSDELDIAVSSPPYSTGVHPAKLSPGTIASDRQHRENIGRDPDSPGSLAVGQYGTSPGQLSGMKDEGIELTISSPPYAELKLKSGGWRGNPNIDPRFKEYGKTDGQLGQMPDEGIDTVADSPTAEENNDEKISTPQDKASSTSREISGTIRKRNDRETNSEAIQCQHSNDIQSLKVNRSNNKTPKRQNKTSSISEETSETIQRRNELISNSEAIQRQQQNDIESPEVNRSNKNNLRKPIDDLQNGENTKSMEGREKSEGISKSNPESELRELRKQREISNSPQGLRSLQQQKGKPSGSMQLLSRQPTHESLLESKEERGKTEIEQQTIKLVTGSPPYAESYSGGTEIFDQLEETHGREFTEKSRTSGHPRSIYQENAGQLGTMPLEDVSLATLAGIASSPPYSDIEVAKPTLKLSDVDDRKGARDDQTWEGYNRENDDNIANLQDNDFWFAAKSVMQSTFNVLKPGGVAFWVVKSFVKDKQIVDFPDQWRRICESVGFETICEIHALLTEVKSRAIDFDGNLIEHKVKRASFFRRLHEKKNPHLAIDWEVVWVMKKPEA